MGEHLAVYHSLVAASVRSQLAYPASFAMQCLAQALAQLEDVVAVLVLFSRVNEMGGFTLPEVLLIYSFAGIAFGLSDLLVGSLSNLGELVRTGTLGALLLRPLPEVTAALLHSPQLLVLDEPTVGLDRISKERLRAFLARASAVEAVTLLLTTHDLPDVERLCRRLVVIDHGRVLVDGSLDELRRRLGGARLLVVDLEQPAAALNGLPGVLDVTVEANGLRQQLAFSAEHTSAAS